MKEINKEEKIITTQSMILKYIDYFNDAVQECWGEETPMTYMEWYRATLRQRCADNYQRYLEGLTLEEVEKELMAHV